MMRLHLILFHLAVPCCVCTSACNAAKESSSSAIEPFLVVGPGVEIPKDRALKVSASTLIKAGSYVRAALGPDGRGGVIVLEHAQKLTLDLAGVELRGAPAGSDLDHDAGFGIVLKDCQDVTIKGGKLGGYKGCIVAEHCQGLVLDGISFDGWYGMHLASTSLAEDQSDWLYPHHDDGGEWITNYGGAISLCDCERATIRGCKGRHGQNGILLTRSNTCSVFDCDFSFLSGWGLALYRSSKNIVSHARFDYCVRGFSNEVYWRGQDSAGILMFERSSDNLFAHSSATHGGDGVFLFAGLDTVEGHAFDKGELDAGGCDRNIWYECDFSFAVANAIEATFSRDNWSIANTLDGSHQHGVWGGYSSRMVCLANEISGTQGGAISIEHGQECAIADNLLAKNDMAIELWWNENKELIDGPFGQHRDTASRDHFVIANRFLDNGQDLILRQTTGVSFAHNTFKPGTARLAAERLESAAVLAPGLSARDVLDGDDGSRPSGNIRDSSVKPFAGKEPQWLERARAWRCPDLPGTLVTSARERKAKQGLDTIVMGEWGPWDFESGEPRPKQKDPGGLFAGAEWQGVWFSWKGKADPRGGIDGAPKSTGGGLVPWRALAASPLATAKVATWINPWGGLAEVKAKVGNDKFGLLANTVLELEVGGKHRLIVNSDDGVRVLVDGKVALENWTWHGPTRDKAELELKAGKHAFAIEYFQIDGATALSVELERVE